MERILFDQEYYNSIMKDFGYDPLAFDKIDFSLGNLTKEDLQRRWLCHYDGNIFSDYLKKPVVHETSAGEYDPLKYYQKKRSSVWENT